MLRIRLARTGRKKIAHYRVVVSESHRTPTGGAATQIGYFDPHTEELSIDTEALQYYLDQGAQPSGRIVRLLHDRDDITLPERAKQNLVIKEEKAAEAEESQPDEQASGERDSSDDVNQSEGAEASEDDASEEDTSEHTDAADAETTESATNDENTTEDAEDDADTEKTS